MSATLELATTSATLVCCYQGCGISFAVPYWWEQKRREDHTMWYCPNGHPQYFVGKSDKELAEERARQAERARDAACREADYYQHRAEHHARRAVALKGVITRTKKRIAKGKCPCCHAEFKDLAGHMQTQHPGYGEDL